MKTYNEINECYETIKKINELNEYVYNPDNYGDNYNRDEDMEIRALIITLCSYLNTIIERCIRLNLDVEDIKSQYRKIEVPSTFKIDLV